MSGLRRFCAEMTGCAGLLSSSAEMPLLGLGLPRTGIIGASVVVSLLARGAVKGVGVASPGGCKFCLFQISARVAGTTSLAWINQLLTLLTSPLQFSCCSITSQVCLNSKEADSGRPVEWDSKRFAFISK